MQITTAVLTPTPTPTFPPVPSVLDLVLCSGSELGVELGVVLEPGLELVGDTVESVSPWHVTFCRTVPLDFSAKNGEQSKLSSVDVTFRLP